ncbi:MAG: hypothetical protein U1F43_13785 [Myxococcota bacterium]
MAGPGVVPELAAFAGNVAVEVGRASDDSVPIDLRVVAADGVDQVLYARDRVASPYVTLGRDGRIATVEALVYWDRVPFSAREVAARELHRSFVLQGWLSARDADELALALRVLACRAEDPEGAVFRHPAGIDAELYFRCVDDQLSVHARFVARAAAP